jgi:plastocyanin
MKLRSSHLHLLLAMTGLSLAVPVTAGTIIGTVRAEGAPTASGSGGGDKYASRRYKFVERVDYAKLTDFVIYVDQVPAEPPPAAKARVVQKDATFEPRVLPVAVGTTVIWPNEDDIYHNVFSMSEPREFNLGLYSADDEPPVITFDKLGRVDVFCSIHTKMHCIVLVLPNPWFALSDANGRFVIRDVPPGTYKLRAWHERLPSATQEITVPAEGEVQVDFVLGLANLPKP